MTTQTKLITYEEYLAGPEIKQRKEIVDGVLVMSAAPNLLHQTVLSDLNDPVKQFVRQNRLGGVWFAPVDVVIQRSPLRVRQPDLLFVSNERAEILGQSGQIEGGPDLVVEILSPSNTRPYIERKLADYARIDVRECWLVSIQARNVEVLRQEGGQWRTAYTRGVGERIESAALPGLELDIAEIFRGIEGMPSN